MAALPTTVQVHRLDAETYARIVASGALDEQRVELIDGVIVEMRPHSPQHGLIIERLNRHFAAARARLRTQLSLQVAADSVPEPDLALVDEPESPAHHPSSALLVVEVAHSSHAIDRGRKAELYASAGVPVYWVVDIPARTVEVRTDPGPSGYRSLQTLASGDVIDPPAPGVEALPVATLFEGIS